MATEKEKRDKKIERGLDVAQQIAGTALEIAEQLDPEDDDTGDDMEGLILKILCCCCKLGVKKVGDKVAEQKAKKDTEPEDSK